MITVTPLCRVNRGSSTAGVRAVNVRSAESPCSGASTRTRSTRSGSITSTEIGPTAVVARSTGARPDACTDRWTPSCRTLKDASITWRFG
jgi:hypothetical protein